jgi:hypothetical protein
MTITDADRRRSLITGAIAVLAPSILIIPALRFLTVCPPKFGKPAAVLLLVVFSASEVFGVAATLRSTTGKLDLIGVLALLCLAVGLVTLAFIVWVAFR